MLRNEQFHARVLLLLLPVLFGLTACSGEPAATPTRTVTPDIYASSYVQRALGITRTPAPSGSRMPAQGQTIYVAHTGGDGVIVRSSANMDARTATVLADGTALTMDRQADGWAHIIEPIAGYIPQQYWSTTPPGPANAPTQATVMYVSADGDGLFSRSAPELSARVTLWPDGTAVTVLGQESDWYRVQTPDGVTGYMPARYVVREKPTPIPPKPAPGPTATVKR
jgi:hypothetical protein